MADLTQLATLLQSFLLSFLGAEYRDLYAVGVLVLGQASLWIGKNVTWSPKHLMKNTRQAWERYGDAEGDNTIRVLCCMAPALADAVLLLVHAAAGLGRKPETKALVRKYHDRWLAKTEELREELEGVRLQLAEGVHSEQDGLTSLKETVFSDHAVEHALTKEHMATLDAQCAVLDEKLKEIERAYVDSTEATVRAAVQKILGVSEWKPGMMAARSKVDLEDHDVRELYHRVLQRGSEADLPDLCHR